MLPRQIILDQHSAYLTIFPVNIVRPFYRDGIRVLLQRFLHTQGSNLGNQEFYYDSWEYEISYDANGEPVYSYTFTLSDSEKNDLRLTNDRVGKTASIGASLSYQGVPYYMNQMNEWVRTFSEKFNDILTSGYASGNEKGIKMFTGNKTTTDAQYEFPDDFRYDSFTYEDYINGGKKPMKVKNSSDSSVSYTHLTLPPT